MRSGTVALIGRANAGKSTLMNVLVGEKIAIVSPKPQTTRNSILGVVNGEDYQIVLIDTPGFYRGKTQLNKNMQRTARRTADDVDLILYILDAHEGLKDDDIELLKTVTNRGADVIVALSKIDIMQKENLVTALAKIGEVDGVKEVIPISARRNKNIKELIRVLIENIPEGEKLIQEDIIVDKSERFMIGEIVREKILLCFDKEVPHGVAVIVNKFELNENDVYEIDVDIICEKENHKAILIGKQGTAIRKVSTLARESMEKFLGKKVFLTTYVKIKEDWRNKEDLLAQYGYNKNI